MRVSLQKDYLEKTFKIQDIQDIQNIYQRIGSVDYSECIVFKDSVEISLHKVRV